MKIGVDARSLSVPKRTPRAGVSRMALNLIQELSRVAADHEYYLYAQRPVDQDFGSSKVIKRMVSRVALRPAIVWFSLQGRKLMVQDCLDVYWGIGQMFPPGVPSSATKVLTVHDLVWRLYPETMDRKNRFISALLVERSVRKADAIVCVSRSTANDLESLLGIPPDKIRVIPNGVSEAFRPQEHRVAAEYIARKYHTSPDYICAVGTLEPRKNLVGLVEAFGILRRGRDFPFQLLIAGGEGWKYSGIYRVVERHGLTPAEIRFLGFVPESDLPYFYSGATALVFPSLYEGFGLPVLEAMACGTPVVASDIATTREVGDGAVLLVPPNDAEAMAAAIARVAGDGHFRRRIAQDAPARARRFSWSAAAASYSELFAEIQGRRESGGRRPNPVASGVA